MAYNSDILLGRITKVNGYEGAVTIKIEKNFFENIPLMESVFLEIEGRLVPFFISGSEYSGADILKLKFEGYNSIDKISEFTGSRVFLTNYIPDSGRSEDIQDLIGYKVLLSDKTPLGVIKAIIPNSGQWLLSVFSEQKKEILIPFHDHFILGIDKKRKILIMDIPEGLTEIN
jgi:16S rRNA processing protein RimM